MKTLKGKKEYHKLTWEEKSGFLDFLSIVPEEVDKFNKTFEFGITNKVSFPSEIDGNSESSLKLGFVLTRDNPLMPEVTYCLYSLLLNKILYGYIGIYRDRQIKTLKHLKPIKDFRKGKVILYEWLRQLVRASCEKMMV
jgi:hypothetical protein